MNRFMGVVLLGALLFTASASGQVERAEMTFGWDEVQETLIPEDGSPPPPVPVDLTRSLGRLRLQDKRGFPLYELRGSFQDRYVGTDSRDLRFAALQALPVPGSCPQASLHLKGIYIEQNPANLEPTRSAALYLMAGRGRISLSLGGDHLETPEASQTHYSVRAKASAGPATLLAAGGHNPDDQDRFLGGAILALPGQILIGGMVASWEDDTGYAGNLGRFNQLGDFAGLPSFSINYIEVPEAYRWTNFRMMWGPRGIHYIRPTFDNRVFSGQYDIDMGLLLTELVPDNYRHFDSPLLFKRYDEYGTVALRVNYIDTDSRFRRVDANLSCNPGIDLGPLRQLCSIVTFERVHYPVFKWQENRYHLTLAGLLFDQVYAGLTWKSDFDEYEELRAELRVTARL